MYNNNNISPSFSISAFKCGDTSIMGFDNDFNSFIMLSLPLSKSIGIYEALKGFLEKGTKVRKVAINIYELHQWVSFKKSGSIVKISSWLEDWKSGKRISKKLQFNCTLQQLMDYVEKA